MLVVSVYYEKRMGMCQMVTVSRMGDEGILTFFCDACVTAACFRGAITLADLE